MKRIISMIIAMLMVASVFTVSSFAKGTLVFSDSFDEGFTGRNWLTKGNKFTWDKKEQCIQGYSDAVVVESAYGIKNNKWWDKYYTSVDFRINDFDDNIPEQAYDIHTVSLWYIDLFESAELNGTERGAVYWYTVEIETGRAYLRKEYENFKYVDEYGVGQIGNINAVIAECQLDTTIEFGNWYNFGYRITDGKIECYFNEQLVMSSSVEDGKVKYGNTYADSVDATVGSEKSCVVLWNCDANRLGGNWMAFDNFEVWTPDYDFVVVDSIPGDANCDGVFDINDVTTLLQSIAGWDLETYDASAADVIGDDGNADMNDVIYMLQTIAGWEGCVIG